MAENTKRIFICSTGRTGTQFFAKYLNKFIKNSVALHEPGTPWVSKPLALLNSIKNYGVFHLTIGQGLNTHSMYKLSRDYIAKKITKQNAIINISNINSRVDKSYNADICVYSSGHIYGIMDLLNETYKDSRFVFVVRDPRTWIGSALNKFEYTLYGPVELFYRNLSLRPSCIENDEYTQLWKSMTKFEKYCWFYNALNTIVLNKMQNKPNFKVFKYEDIFLSENKKQHFNELLDFATNFDSGRVEYQNLHNLLDKKVDSKQKSQTCVWEHWEKEKAKIMHKHCGALMKTFGYGNEPLWLNMIGETID